MPLPAVNLFVPITMQPVLTLLLGFLGALYFAGATRFWERPSRRSILPIWRPVAYACGLVAVGVALFSPLDAFATRYFAAHMAQHLLLTQIAAPLLSLGIPVVPMLWAVPPKARQALGAAFARQTFLASLAHQLTRPPVALAVHTVTVWFWHIPEAYEAALRSNLTHDLQHATLMVTALLFWWPVIHPIPGRPGLAHGARLLYIAVAMVVQSKVLGALLTFSNKPIYQVYLERQDGLGINALVDQQLAGVQMLVGSATLMLIAASTVFARLAAREKV